MSVSMRAEVHCGQYTIAKYEQIKKEFAYSIGCYDGRNCEEPQPICDWECVYILLEWT